MKGEMKGSLADIVGLSDVTRSSIWRALAAEFIGTFFLVFVGCGSCTKGWSPGYEPSVLHIALCFGLTVAAMVQVTGHVSGGHINPAVSIGLLVSGQLTMLRCAFYVLVQCIGAVAGAAVLRVITPSEIASGAIGLTSVSEALNAEQAVLVEALATAVLVLVVHAVVDLSGKASSGGSVAASPGPLAIGLAVSTCHLLAVNYTGSSMNPARSFGPAVLNSAWDNHWLLILKWLARANRVPAEKATGSDIQTPWKDSAKPESNLVDTVYWVGPILGGSTSALIYKFVLSGGKAEVASYDF